MGETIDAQTALRWGVVSEVVAHDRALKRGVEIAQSLAAKPALYRSLPKQTLNVNTRQRPRSVDPRFDYGSRTSAWPLSRGRRAATPPNRPLGKSNATTWSWPTQ
ncbi:MAG TPA: hypothetical protein VME44_27580, partial [Streptosporangiaceae bacterium]|nr:hypothetical protein [Streptosporangiaceae bacterium]